MTIPFYLMSAVSVMMLARGVIFRRRLWEAPTWAGFIFVAFLIPQAIYIEVSGTGESLDAQFVWYYVTFCLIAFWWGFEAAKRSAGRAKIFQQHRLNDRHLTPRTVVILTLGAFSLLKIREITAVEDFNSWAGIVALYYLIFQFIFMALAISIIRYLQTGRQIWAIFSSIAIFLAIIAIAANAKRSLTAEIFFILGVSLYFLRDWRPPRSAIIAVMLFGTVVVHQVGPIRDYIAAGKGTAFDAVWAGVPFENFVYFNPTKAPELTQGVADIYRTNQTGGFTGPAVLWNKMVNLYVPAFLVGRSFKQGLQFSLPGYSDESFAAFNWNGATRTGFSDSYTGYGIFGVFVFALVGWIMGKIYIRARAGVHWALFLYPLLLNDSMFAFTESTARFFSGGSFVVLVTLFMFWRSSAGHLPRRETLQLTGFNSVTEDQIAHHSSETSYQP